MTNGVRYTSTLAVFANLLELPLGEDLYNIHGASQTGNSMHHSALAPLHAREDAKHFVGEVMNNVTLFKEPCPFFFKIVLNLLCPKAVITGL